jgi:plasmid stabilization system protein ParE
VKPHAFHPEADGEYAEAAKFYAEVDPELGGRFFEEIESLISDIRRQPGQFPLFDPPIRRHFSSVFPYAVLYLDQPDRVLIIAVMHMKQRPGYWRDRLL